MEQLPLLIENPPFVLAPNIELTQSNVKRMIEERKKGNLYDCDNCGKALGSPYYIMIGIPPSPLIIDVSKCESIDKEIDIGKSIMPSVQYEARTNDESKYQWIFSEQNIMNSKIRVCSRCFEKCTPPRFGQTLYRIHLVRFAIDEYQRRHTPIEPSISNYEKYIISLPDRTNVHWDPYGEVDEDNFGTDIFEEYLTVALIPGYKPMDALSQEFRANFIQDKDRVIPNDQELTIWMKKCISERIQFCKIFVNPKAGKFPIDQDVIDEECTPRYKIVVHYSDPKGDWDVYDIPDMGETSETYMQMKRESVYSRSSHKKTKVLTLQ